MLPVPDVSGQTNKVIQFFCSTDFIRWTTHVIGKAGVHRNHVGNPTVAVGRTVSIEVERSRAEASGRVFVGMHIQGDADLS